MGAACCVAARDKSHLPRGTSSEDSSRNIRYSGPSRNVRYSGPSRNVRYSPTWSCRQGRVSDEVDDPPPPHGYSHGNTVNIGFETKNNINVECGDISERQPLSEHQTVVLQKSFSNEEAGLNSMSSTSEPFTASSSFNKVKDLMDPLAVADPSASRLSSSIPPISSSMSNEDLSSERHSPPADFTTPSSQARHSPGYHLPRQVSDSRPLDWKSPNNSISEGRQSFMLSTCSNDLTLGSLGGGSSDSWSMSTFSDLVATSQRERWSFDSETLDIARSKATRSSSCFLAPPSIDLRKCGVCMKLLMEKSPWVTHKFILSNELSVVAVLVCGHVYHAECLENATAETYRFDPACPVCTTGDSQALTICGKTLNFDTDTKARNRKSRSRVVDGHLDLGHTVHDQWKSPRREGKGLMLGSSSSMKNSLTKPFLRLHFSLGSKSTKSILENQFSVKSPSRKGFWSRYRKG